LITSPLAMRSRIVDMTGARPNVGFIEKVNLRCRKRFINET